MHLRRRLVALTFGLAGAGLAGGAAADTMTTDFADRWVSQNDAITLTLPQEIWANRSALRVFVGKTDVTALSRGGTPGQIVIDPALVPLPPGESDVVVWRIDGSSWEEVARAPIRVLERGDFESMNADATVEVQLKGRAVERRLVEEEDPERTLFLDSVSNIGFSFSGERGGTTYEASASLTGSSYRPEALRFGDLGEEAPKLDLAEYGISVSHGGSGIRLGHVSYGNHPLLLDGMSSRGVILTGRPTDRFDVSLNIMNGSEIVGYNNFFGLREVDHRVHGLTAGYEIFGERPGALRAELSLMHASVQAIDDFNAGEISDAERSRGVGLRFTGATEGGRVTADVAWARSIYVNPFDPFLAQGEDLQPVQEARSSGRVVDVGIGLLDDARVFSDEHGLGLRLSLHHDRIDPLYKSIGSFFATDQLLNRVGLDADYRGALLQISGGRKRDNLDDIPTLLTTQTDTRTLSLSLPLPSWLGMNEETGRSAWPSVNYRFERIHQIALNVPDTEDSGFADSQRPDQLNKTHGIDFSWLLDPVTLTYGFSYADQDNRQQGRQNADFKDRTHSLSLSWAVNDGLSVNGSLGRNRNTALENDLTTYATNGSFGADWCFASDWQFSFNIDRTLSSDSDNAASSRNTGGAAQLGYRFEIADGLRKMPGQVFVRYSRQDSLNSDNIFEFRDEQRHWYIDVGFSLSLF
jgi:hypothetical protein